MKRQLLIPLLVVAAALLLITGAVVGLLIAASVEADGPAAAAGIEVGDVIRSVDGQVVRTPEQLRAAVAAKAPGDSVSVTYERGDRELRAQVTLAVAPPDAQIEAQPTLL